jgi:hypothetical protein
MADIIELEIVAKATGLKPMVSTVERLERQLIRATKALDQNKISQDRYNKIILSTKQQYAALGVSAQRANSQVDKMAMSLKNTQAADQAAAAANNLARETDNLSRKYKPLYAATQLYEKGLMEIKRATTLGVLSNEEAIESTMRLKSAFNSATTGMSGGINQAGRSTNQLGVVAQQTGYQVGDFLVQIQSGANPMMAFGQQATQLVGVLPLLSDQLGVSAGKLMGIAAGLGILIPLATAIAGYFLRLAGEVKESGDALSSFGTSMGEVRTAIETSRSSVAELGEEFGYIAADIKKIQDAIIQASINEAFRDMADAVSPFSSSVSEAFDRIVTLQQQMAGMDLTIGSTSQQLQQVEMFDLLGAEVDDILANLGLTAYELVKIRGGFDRISAAGVAQDTEAMAAAALESISYLNSLSSSSEETSASIDQAVIFVNKLLEAAGLTAAAINGSAEGMKIFTEMTERAAEAAADQAQAVKEIKDTVQDNVNSLQMELDLSRAILAANGDSAKIDEAKAVNARNQVLSSLQNEGVLGNNLKIVMDIYDANVTVDQLINSQADSAKELADALKDAASAMSSLTGFSVGLDRALAVSIAKVEALKSGTDAAIAGSIAGMRLDLDARSSAAITGGADPLEVRAERAIGRSSIDSLEQSELERKAIEEANRERGRSGGGKSEDQPDFVEALRAEMVVREQLVKLYGDEYELQSEIARIVEGLGKDSGDYNAQAIEALAQQNILLKEQEVLRDEAAAQMESIYQMLGNEIGAFTTAMISDTKSVEEAFKSMAKNIIDQLIQIFIVEQLVNSISGGMGSFFGGGGGSSKKALSLSANGNVFSGGSQVQAYANGGVVNGPTMFPMNGNKTGLMGEAGPEAIMPLKRGANGKLGVQAEGSGGDNVVIHQNFNFQANGDDSVKKLIQQAAPQIAQMTKSSMLNDRRRGGQTKAVFG